MINRIRNIFTSTKSNSFQEWKSDDSIYKFLSNNISATGALTEAGQILPINISKNHEDEEGMKFAPGLMDAMFGENNSGENKKIIKELTKHLALIAKNNDKQSEVKFYTIVKEHDGIINIIDLFLSSLSKKNLPIEPYLFPYAKSMALETDTPNTVKMGIALLGLCQNRSVLNELKILGLHDEFTVFTAIAISNLSNAVETDLWELAKKVDGWGKIQIVDRLATMDISQDIKDWLITEGYKNSIMYEYLAYTCAVYGELHTKLQSDSISKKIFDSTGEILDALLNFSGPVENISDYEHSITVITNYIRHAQFHANQLSAFLVLNKIKDYLEDNDNTTGLKQNDISNYLIDINTVLNAVNWNNQIYAGLESTDNVMYWNAKLAASILKIDIWDIIWKKLNSDSGNSTLWYDIVNNPPIEKIDDIINLALNTIPHKELATGPKLAMGFGSDYGKYATLDTIVIFLENHPGKGEQLILSSLNSPVIRNRNMALRTLEKWGKSNWKNEINIAVKKLSQIEPNKDTLIDIRNLLQTGKI